MSDNVQFPQYSADGLPITYVPNPFLADGKPIDSQWKQPVRVHTEGNIVLSGLQIVDGVAVMEGDRVLVRIQANAAENGIYIASAGAWLRAPDMYLWPQFVAAVVATEEGISIGDTVWVCDAPVNGVVGVTPNNWIQVSQSTGTLGVFTPLRAIVSDAGGNPTASPTTSQEIAYLGGVTSSVQQQFNALDNKASSAFSIAVAGTNAAAGAQSTANSALSTANSAFALAQIGTNTGSAAYSLAQTGSNIAYDAYAIAEAGTTIGSLAYNYATALGDIYVRTTRFATISSGTSGSVALPPNSSVVLDDFGGTTDAVITVMVGGMPTFNHAFTTAGAIVTTTFDSSGAYALSGPPDPYPVALVYRVRQKLSQFDSTGTDIIGDYDVEPVNFIAGTPNQVYVNGSTTAQFGSIILSTPQDIAPTSTPTFAGLTSTGSVYSPNIDQTTQVAYSGSSVAWAAWELAQIGTNTGGGGTLAQAAWELAQIGTNTGTAAYTLAQAGTSSLFTYVRNAGTVVIGSGSAVSVLSSDGTVSTVILATNAVRFVARAVLGLASGSIAAGGYGYICHYGSVSGVDLTGVATGASLFLETHGSITPYLPVAPTSKVFVAFCLSPGSQGSAFVLPQVTDALSELSDVELSSRSIGDGIVWNGSLWTNLAYTSTPAYQLADSAYTLAYQAEVDAQFATIQSSEALQLAQAGTNTGSTAYSVAQSAWALAQIGTNTGTAALNAAATAQSTANSAFSIAVIGTNAAASAQSTADSAWALAQIGTNTGTAALSAVASAQSTADTAYFIAQIGTNTGTVAYNTALSAQSTANSAYFIAEIGTNTGTAAYTLAESGSSVAWSAWVLANAGTELPQSSYDLALAAYHLAEIGTNVGTAALNAAATAQSTADTAYYIAQVGTNTGTAAYELATSGSNVAWAAYVIAQDGTSNTSTTALAAYALAQIGTNTGSAAYELASFATNTGTAALNAAASAQSTADSAFSIAVIGTNAAVSAQSTADSAWSVAQIGTNTGSTAYAVAEQAYALAQLGTVIPPLSALPDVYIPSPMANQSLIFNGSVWVASDSQHTAVGAGIVFYLDGEFTEFPGYEKLLFQPADIPEAVETIDANQSFGDVLIDPYLSVGTADRDVMDGGLWTYNTYCSTTGSDCRMHVETFLYDGTTENLLWDFYFPITPNGVVNLEQVTLVKPAAPVTKGVDRILVKYFGTCSSAGTHQITLYHSGSEHYSNIQTPFLYAHNALPGLQGGTSPDQFYHVTHTINDGLNAADNPSGTNAFITASALAPTTSIAQSAYLIAESGSNTANSAFALAQIGTNTGSAAYALADEADSIADSAFAMAQIGTNTGTAALAAAATAQSTANSAFSIAVAGTNAAATAQSTANSALSIASIGTNTGSAAYSVAQSAFSLAQIGTNTGSTAYSVAQSAFSIASIGTNTGSTAYSVANSAWNLAQIGTNTGTAAYTLAESGSSVAWQAYSLALQGTSHTLAGLTDVALTGPTAQQVLTYNGSIWINDDVPVVISPSTFNLYLDDTASGTAGYNTLKTISGGTEVLDSIAMTSNSPTPIESYISSGVSVTVLPAGVWLFENYVSATNTGRDVVVTTDVYTRSMAGVETYLFSGTTDVFSPVGTPSRVIATAATGSYSVALTDKLVVKYWFIKSAGGNTTLTLYHNGSNHASFIQTTLGFVHNQLAGLQGGTSNEYYHTTANQNAALVGDGGTPSAANPYSTHQFTAAIQNTANSAFSIAQVGTNTGSTAYSVAQSAWTLAQFGTTQSAAGAYQLAQVGTNIGSYAVAYAVPAYSIAQIGTNTGSAAYSYAAAAYALAQTGTNADATTRSIANSAFSVAQIGTNTGSTAYSVAQSAWTLAQQGTHSVSTISNGTTLISASPASYVYLCNTSSGSVVLVLPNALGWSGQRVNAKMIGSAGSVIMRSSTGSQTIDGALNQTVYTQYVSIQVTTDGLNWYII